MFRLVNKARNKKGFTLVELVVVIAILGILAAIAVPRLLGFQQRANEQSDKQAAVQIRNALALLNANGEIPWHDTNDGDADTVIVTIDGDVAALTDFALTGTAHFTATPVAADVTAVQTALYALIDDFELKGTRDIIVQITKDGTVTVTQP